MNDLPDDNELAWATIQWSVILLMFPFCLAVGILVAKYGHRETLHHPEWLDREIEEKVIYEPDRPAD